MQSTHMMEMQPFGNTKKTNKSYYSTLIGDIGEVDLERLTVSMQFTCLLCGAALIILKYVPERHALR